MDEPPMPDSAVMQGLDAVPATPEALEEALALSAEILADIELSRGSLTSAALKAARLARLLNDQHAQLVFQYEAGGYPAQATGIPPEVWKLVIAAGRTYETKDDKTGEVSVYGFRESIEQLEDQIATGKIALHAAQDRDVSVSSANPSQYVGAPAGNTRERVGIRMAIDAANKRLASRRAFIHQYTSRRHYELKFSGAAQDVFASVRETVDGSIADVVPEAVQKFASVHDNLRSANPEDWSNAVHSCRRILQDLADALFPAQAESRVAGNGHEINLGADNYINRLACFAEDHSSSPRFKEIVGSHLSFLGDRLDAVFKAAQKGSHSSVTRDEANRYVIYTYMLVADLLSLRSAAAGSDRAG